MRIRLVGRRRLALVLSCALSVIGGPGRTAPPAPPPEGRPFARLRWLSELGAESLATSHRIESEQTSVLAAVPGAAYLFATRGDGSLVKRLRLAADPSAPYGMATSNDSFVVADRRGALGLWTFTGSEVSSRWRTDVGDRVTSVGWNGGERVAAATWKGRLLALGAADGRTLWSTDIGGRAEAPAVFDGDDVLVATKGKQLLRLDAATGVVRWRAALPGLTVHPATLLGREPRLVLCGTWDGQLLAHDLRTGLRRWSVALPDRLIGAPMALDESVAVITADGAVRAYDAAGVLRWTTTDAARGPAALVRGEPSGRARRLVSVSKVLTEIDAATGSRMGAYPEGAVAALQRRFAEAMLEGVKTYSEAEKGAWLERDAFEIPGPLFGPARLAGRRVAFGTEDGWVYTFDAATLAPLARYQAGLSSSGTLRLAGDRLVATAGEDVFALDLVTGRTLWRRVVGADPGAVAGETTLAVAAGGRIHALAPADGSLQWSLRGAFRSLAPLSSEGEEPHLPWIADDGEGHLRAFLPPGQVVGEPLPVGGTTLCFLPAPGGWVVATREGRLFSVAWDDAAPGKLTRGWEVDLAEPITEARSTPRRFLVRSRSALVALDSSSRQETWRIPLAPDDRFEVLGGADTIAILGETFLRLHDLGAGETRLDRRVSSPAVGIDAQAHQVSWLDRAGWARRLDRRGGSAEEAVALGAPLSEARAARGGFLVTTPAGEVGFVDVETAGPASAGAQEPARE